MNAKLMWLLFLPVFLFFLVMFGLEVSLYDILPAEEGGMGFWAEFKHTWYRSVWFYALLAVSLLLIYATFFQKKKK